MAVSAMHDLLTDAFLTAFVTGTLLAATPLLLAGLGEQIAEKAGVLNIGLEGMMLLGAYAGFVAAYDSGSIWLGFAAGGIAGMVPALLMALFCVRLGMNQIVIGIALTLGAEGITSLAHHAQFSRTYPRLPQVETLAIPLFDRLPMLGSSLFNSQPLVYVALGLVGFVAWLFRSTHVGLNLQAGGDKPTALGAAGVSVLATRSCAELAAGFLAGVGGAYLSTVGAGLFVPFMTNGAGFIAIVLAMLARGRPVGVLLGALLFSACLSLATALQVAGFNIPTDVVQMIPFAMVMIVLVLFARRAHLPAALGLPYQRGAR